jgi:hypothetical protein
MALWGYQPFCLPCGGLEVQNNGIFGKINIDVPAASSVEALALLPAVT